MECLKRLVMISIQIEAWNNQISKIKILMQIYTLQEILKEEIHWMDLVVGGVKGTAKRINEAGRVGELGWGNSGEGTRVKRQQ